MDSDEKRRRNNHRRRRCIIILSDVVLTILIIPVIIATVFLKKRPITTVNSVVLRNLDVSFSALRLSVNLNVSLDVNISVTNPNKDGFKYSDSSAFLDYRGQAVGQAPLPAVQINSCQTVTMDLTLTVMADRLLSNLQVVISDVVSSVIPITTRTRISGKVIVIFIKILVASYAVCNLNVSIASKSVLNNDCKYQTHLS